MMIFFCTYQYEEGDALIHSAPLLTEKVSLPVALSHLTVWRIHMHVSA